MSGITAVVRVEDRPDGWSICNSSVIGGFVRARVGDDVAMDVRRSCKTDIRFRFGTVVVLVGLGGGGGGGGGRCGCDIDRTDVARRSRGLLPRTRVRSASRVSVEGDVKRKGVDARAGGAVHASNLSVVSKGPDDARVADDEESGATLLGR
jgi:hypothetical protein